MREHTRENVYALRLYNHAVRNDAQSATNRGHGCVSACAPTTYGVSSMSARGSRNRYYVALPSGSAQNPHPRKPGAPVGAGAPSHVPLSAVLPPLVFNSGPAFPFFPIFCNSEAPRYKFKGSRG